MTENPAGERTAAAQRSTVAEPSAAAGGTVNEIEAESYRILRSLVDLSRMPPLSRAVTERVIHASADVGYASDLVCDEAALAAGREALADGAPVVADVAMVAAGITGLGALCKIGDSLTARLARAAGITRSAAAVRLSFSEAGPGAVWVVGCAPTALEEIIAREVRPALVIGLPVGFAGAAEAKEALRASGLPAVSNVSAKGGSAVAAAAVNALLRTLGTTGAPGRGRAGGTGAASIVARGGRGDQAPRGAEQRLIRREPGNGGHR